MPIKITTRYKNSPIITYSSTSVGVELHLQKRGNTHQPLPVNHLTSSTTDGHTGNSPTQ
jgi:hypothetical protein